VMIFGFFSQNLKTQAVAVAFSMAWLGSEVEPGADRDDVQSRDRLAVFRGELYGCLTARGDALCEVADAVLCGRGRVQVLAELSLEPECRRGHGGVYDAVNAGRVDIGRLRRALAGVRLPGWPDGRIRLAADVSSWLRPDAVTSPERLFCVHRPRGGGEPQMVPGWPYSVLVALEPGRTSWTLPLDAVRLGPADEHTFRFLKQVLGWTAPRLRDPAAADRWTWLILACYAQLWLARDLAADHRLPWQQPCPPGRLTPARVRQGFRCIHATMPPWPPHRNPPAPAPAAPPAPPTGTPPPATPSARPPNEPAHSKTPETRQVKSQASRRYRSAMSSISRTNST
jgi:DDE superfamily endonuclease